MPKDQATLLPRSTACELRRKLRISAEDAEFLLGWPYKTWIQKENTGQITFGDIANLKQRVIEVDLTKATPKEFQYARESVGIYAKDCSRLLGKGLSWWKHRESGMAKSPRFYIDAMLSLAPISSTSKPKQVGQLSEHKANSQRRQLGVTAGDADFLLGWPYKSWSKKEHAGKITTDDIATLAQRVAEADLSEAKPEEFLAARESVGLFAEECDRLLGKTPSWWLNREIGLAKAPRFYIEAMLCLALPCKRVYFDDESGQRLLRYFIKQRIRVGNTCRDVDRALGKRKGWWFSVEAGSQKYVFESDIEALDHHFMLLANAEKMASQEEIRVARESFGMSRPQAAALMKWHITAWFNRECGKCKMTLRDLNKFIKLASQRSDYTSASGQELRVQKTA